MAHEDNLSELHVLAERYHLPAVMEITDDMLDPALVTNLPLDWVRKHLSLPIRWQDGLGVLIAEPLELEAPKYLALLFAADMQPILAERAQILAAIERCYYRGSSSAEAFLADLPHTSTPDTAGQSRADDLLAGAAGAPVSQLVNLILLGAVKAGASDIHIEPFEQRLRLRYRVDGVLYDQTAPPKHLEPALTSRLKVMAHMDIAEKRLPQDGAARVRVGERELDVRISTIPVVEGERVVLRLLNRDEAVRPLDSLGMPLPMLEKFQALLSETNGIIIVCGPTGSGKTTTLYAALQQLDRAHTNILTIEDPVEYQLPDIGQMQVKPKIGLDFAGGLRHILRQDPDTILVGEIRDQETAEIAVRASLTGHLVFSTLHTNDAVGAVLRFLDMGTEPYLLAASLRAVLAQRLARRLCPACAIEGDLTAAERDWLVQAGTWKPQDGSQCILRAGTGCGSCIGGYRGRVGLFELLIIEQALGDLVRSGKCDATDLRVSARQAGMQTLVADGSAKVLARVTDLTELRRVIGRRH